MKKESKIKKSNEFNPIIVFIRYLILLISMFSITLIYQVFTPLTINSLTFLLKMFNYSISIHNSLITINELYIINIVPACIAGSAYLLLLILNLSTPMPIKKRIYSIFFSFIVLFLVNILRLLVLSILSTNNKALFDSIHFIVWNFLSTIFVIVIWFLTVKVFAIKDIPIYTDIKSFIKNIRK